MTTLNTTIENLNKKFNSLNRKYVKLDKSFNNKMTSSEEFELSEKLENIQIEMGKVSTKLEDLGAID